MGMHTTKVAVGEGKFTLEAQLTVTPRGMAVYACSPEFAHLGATAQSVCHIPFLRNLQILQVSKVTSYKLAKNASL